MRKSMLVLALLVSTGAQAQTLQADLNSSSGANANSGSTSGAASNQTQGQGQSQNSANYNGISTSGSASTANSGSVSNSGSASDQTQGQSLSSQQGQTATNQQGVQVSNTFNSVNRKTTEVRTNSNVPLAASVSFSSDYCAGTASGGLSIAGIGVSAGAGSPVADPNCQALRRAEKMSILAATAQNMGLDQWSSRLMAVAIFEACGGSITDSKGAPLQTTKSCEAAGLIGPNAVPGRLAVTAPAVVPTPPAAAQPPIPATEKKESDEQPADGELGSLKEPNRDQIAAMMPH